MRHCFGEGAAFLLFSEAIAICFLFVLTDCFCGFCGYDSALRFAAKAGLADRTLNGMALLCFILPSLFRQARASASAEKSLMLGQRVVLKSIGCTFGSPVYLRWDAVEVSLRVLAVVATPTDATVHFEVSTQDSRRAIRAGFATIGVANSALERRRKVRKHAPNNHARL